MMETKVKVLIVDDDRRMVKTICDILRIKGFTVSAAHSGEEALDKIRAEEPDCVLMDIKMPGLSGVEALGLIKGLSPDLPVVLMSAYVTEDMERDAREQGAYAVLTKPIDIQMVLSFLSHLKNEDSILVVDDDPLFCGALRDILQQRKYRVSTEWDPGNVLGRLEQDYQLAVILDLKLANADGLDVLQAIRAKYPTKPVLLVTGHEDTMAASIAKSRRIGAYTCICRPLDTDVLFQSIREIKKRKLQNVLGEQFRA